MATIVALSNVLGPNNPRVDNAGMTYALLDAQNTAIGQAADPTSGRNDGFITLDADGKPIVKVRSYQRDTEATRTTKSCEGTPKPFNEEQHTISMYRETSISFDWKYMSSLCGEASTVVAGGRTPTGEVYKKANTPIMNDIHQQLMSRVFKLVADINKDLSLKMASLVGVNRRTGLKTAKNYALWRADDTKNMRGYNELQMDYLYHGFGGTPILVGGAELGMFANEMNWAALNGSGIDAAAVTSQPVRTYLDKEADVALGLDNFLVMAPGFAKLLTYNEYGGIFTGSWGTGEFGQFTIPEFGDQIRFDLHIEKETCPGPKAVLIVGLHYDVFVPKNIFAAGDPMAGVNGLTLGKVTKLAA